MDTFSSALGELFPGENMEGSEDLSSEWLSIYVEDCYTTTSHPIPTPTTTTTTSSNPNPQSPLVPPQPPQNPKPSSKDRPKRRKSSPRAHPYDHFPHTFHADPPLLHQTHWLAESELLIFPKKQQETKAVEEPAAVVGDGEDGKEEEGRQQQQQQQQQPRRCTHCLSQRTPQWRQGPLGPKTLCNACGVRFKSGRLLPEYRPAKSPTFESYKHSNSHKKVMEMRMALLSSHSS